MIVLTPISRLWQRHFLFATDTLNVLTRVNIH
jgi:hypothetical protein